MKRILSLLLFVLFCNNSFSQVPDTTGPFRALEMWNNTWQVDYPTTGAPLTNIWDHYYRFSWGDIETINSTTSQYSWTVFDQQIHYAMDNRAKFNFAVMPYFTGGSGAFTTGGALLAYPLYLHNQMQAESAKDWISTSDGAWVQDWNSPSYLASWTNLQNAIANHIATTSYQPSWSSKPIPYSSVIGYVDVRSYGNFGEWHSYPWGADAGYATHTPTYAAIKALIDVYINAFPNYWLNIGMQSFGNDPNCDVWDLTDPQIGYYALTAKNNKGLFGWRRDNWGANETYYTCNLEGNTITYNGLSFANEVVNRWKYAPVLGEPYQCCTTDNGAAGDYYYDLAREVNTYRPTMLGNGNMDNGSSSLTISRFQQAGSLMGYKLQISNDSVSKNIAPSGAMKIYSKWTNRGLTPNYEDWNVKYQLRNSSNAVVWEGASSFVLKLFLPSTVSQVDSYTLPANIPTGTYSLYAKVVDPNGYRLPLILRQAKQSSDTAYLINSSVVVGNVVTPPPPPSTDSVNLIVIVGESNAAGRANDVAFTDLDNSAHAGPTSAELATRKLQILNESLSSLVFQNLVLGGSSPNNQTPGGTVGGTGANPWNGYEHGIELGLANAIDSGKLSSSTYVVKAGYGGLKIQQMLPSTSPNVTDGGVHWNDIVTYTDSAISILKSNGHLARLYVFMSEGLNDRFGNNTTAAAAKPYFQEFITDFRARYGSNVLFALTKFRPAVMGSTAQGNAQGYDYNSMFDSLAVYNKRLYTISADSTTWWFSQGDHWDYAGMKILAKRFVDIINGTVPVVTPPANKPPVAKVVNNITVQLPTNSVVLDGSASSDSDGTISSYLWKQLSGPNTSTLSNSTTSKATASNLVAGTYVFNLLVTDNLGATGTANDTVVVKPSAVTNQPPVASVVKGITVQLPTNSTPLDGSSSSDPNGSRITSYSWSQVSGPNSSALSNQNTSIATASNLIAGTYIFKLTVTDSLGLSGSTNDTVTVKPAIVSNQPPVAVTVTDTVQLPMTTAVLDGRASRDPDGTIASYNWVQTSGPIFGTISYPDSSYTVVLNLTLAGNYTFSLTVTDNQGATSTATENVVVKSAVTGVPMEVSIYNIYGQFVIKKVVYSYNLTELEQGLYLKRGVYIAKYSTGVVMKFYVHHHE